MVSGIAEDLMGSDQICIVLGDPQRNADLRTLAGHVDTRGAYGIGTEPSVVADAFGVLMAFYREAAFAGDAVVIWLT